MEKSKKTNTKSILISLVILIILISGSFVAYHYLRQQGEIGTKTIHVNITVDEITINSIDIQTDAAYLRQALDEHQLIQGEESLYGFMVNTVNGKTADVSKQEWWCFIKGGEMLTTGVDDTPLEDGDTFEIALRVGYEW